MSHLFGAPDERLETEAVLKKLGVTRNRLANMLNVHRSTVGRWRKWIPKEHHGQLKHYLDYPLKK